MHILAESPYWWQRRALEYLIQRGHVEAKNKAAITHLHSVSQRTSGSVAVGALLRHGANLPNTLDAIGMSFLSKTDSYQGSSVNSSKMEPRYLYNHFPRPERSRSGLRRQNLIPNPLSPPDRNLTLYSCGRRFFLILSAC